MKKICIVGAGTAGLVSALILKTRFPSWKIDVIYSDKIGIVGVGEGSTEHWEEFMNFVGITHEQLFKEVDSTCKSGIMFKGWGSKDYIQNISAPLNMRVGKYPAVYAKLISDGVEPKELQNVNNWDSMVDEEVVCPTRQFHFNTFKLHDFLMRQCEQRGIGLIEDEIGEVACRGQQEITWVKGRETTYEYDFYIDSTGFRKELISRLGAEWVSYEDYLHVNSAIMFPLENEEYNMWTTAQAMKYGWMFTIPVWGRTGNGYIYDGDYITKEQAIQEVEQFLGRKVEVAKELKFTPGRLDKFWIGNCLSVGLSSSFVEPLEASSIGSTIQQIFMFVNDIAGDYNQSVIDRYNDQYSRVMDNIRDFIVLHYLCDRNDTEFWEKVKTTIPDSLQKKLDIFKRRLPLPSDFDDTDYALFNNEHYIMVMNGCSMFDIDKVKQEYSSYESFDNAVKEVISGQRMYEKDCSKITHKQYLEMQRNLVAPQ
jgi:tryptophan halogenase